mmetsp:Transcript_25733/g.63016  ORF Transcript_25733/g.63016 Transcript_25733/m.63016 type:complete len:334 (+) Transcript_25733:33-1034(+)|eukprot:CAMPEP_0113601268 /NCGR_PEP_ID=MMETSP0017_2-20120614/139_1 /TAXON_ID=2856 /ORGANISM="Cylindrotheca closterium" /LENGTH=333 /DNA_ID=CAMNT_0000509551 /DNA_START=33 /DNA_END=1034 /DNA_ORIENTATION=- /assembly_acc=CAM_ASM_000147
MSSTKLFIMLPVMLAARKLDGEDPKVVNLLRLAYGGVQACCVLLVLFTYFRSTAAAEKAQGTIYVPPAPQPFADPNGKKKYTEVKYGAHLVSTARSLLGSTLFGICMTVGLHLYKGMVVGLAIQTIMGPINLLENPLVKALVLGNGLRQEDKIFSEKTTAELTDADEIVDESGNPVSRQTREGRVSGGFEDLLLDTWDAGNKADVGKLLAAVNKQNCNFKTSESGWTPLMILSGLNAAGVRDAIRQLIEIGGDPRIVDGEGWNSLHWAAFHGSVEAAKELLKDDSLMLLKDKDGKVPLDMAKSEGNTDVAKFLEAYRSTDTPAETSTGLRKRK